MAAKSGKLATAMAKAEKLVEAEKIVEGTKVVKTAVALEEGVKLLSKREIVESMLKPGGNLLGEQVGNNFLIRTVSKEKSEDIIRKLIDLGAKRVEKIDYPGIWYKLPEVGEFGIRAKSSQASLKLGTSNTIDVEKLKMGIDKIKY